MRSRAYSRYRTRCNAPRQADLRSGRLNVLCFDDSTKIGISPHSERISNGAAFRRTEVCRYCALRRCGKLALLVAGSIRRPLIAGSATLITLTKLIVILREPPRSNDPGYGHRSRQHHPAFLSAPARRNDASCRRPARPACGQCLRRGDRMRPWI